MLRWVVVGSATCRPGRAGAGTGLSDTKGARQERRQIYLGMRVGGSERFRRPREALVSCKAGGSCQLPARDQRKYILMFIAVR